MVQSGYLVTGSLRTSSVRSLRTGGERLPRATAPPAETEALEREDERAFRQRLTTLPDTQRDALALRYGADLTIADVGSVLGKSQDATEKQISRGLARLRETYDDAD